jgi:hypothetical protein
MKQIKITSNLCYPNWLKPSKSDRIANALVIVTLAGCWVAILISILAS